MHFIILVSGSKSVKVAQKFRIFLNFLTLEGTLPVSITGAFGRLVDLLVPVLSIYTAYASLSVAKYSETYNKDGSIVLGCIFILSRESDQCAIRARLGVARYLSLYVLALIDYQ